MVTHLPVLLENLTILGMKLPLYKILQYGSGVAGLLVIFSYLLYYQHNHKVTIPSVATKQKISIWVITMLITIIVFMLWHIAFPVSIKQYGTLVVRLIDAGCAAVIILTVVLRVTTKITQ